jgi:hypothetical protein
LCSMATPEYSEPLLLENYIRIVALAPDLQKVSVDSATEFLYHSSTIELLSLLTLTRTLGPHYYARNRPQPWGYCGTQIHARSPRGSVPVHPIILGYALTSFYLSQMPCNLQRNESARIFNLRG